MSFDTVLGIAIDHRIRRLLGPVRIPPTEPNLDRSPPPIQSFGESLGIPADEINVTTELAAPHGPGGIVVVLKQPRDSHPFSEGTDAVIQECATLAALDELFDVASHGTINMRRDVSVIDLLPYVRPKDMDNTSDGGLADAFETCIQTIQGKGAQVALCCSKVWDDGRGSRTARRHDMRIAEIKGKASLLENIGIGRTFGASPTAWLGWLDIHRVNAFHPSHVMNYNPDHSRLRQLLLLTVAEACGVYCRDWVEYPWFTEFRDSCKRLQRKLPRERKRDYIRDYEQRYSAVLDDMERVFGQIMSSGPENELYTGLVHEGSLTELCNDAVLILSQLSSLPSGGNRSPYREAQYSVALACVARKTHTFTAAIMGNQRWPKLWFGSAKLRELLSAGIRRVNASIGLAVNGSYTINLDIARGCFLQMAIDLENLLGEESKRSREPPILEVLEGLSAALRSFSLSVLEAAG